MNKRNTKRTQEEFVKEVFDLVGDEFTVVGEYINTDTMIKLKHNKCNQTFDSKPHKFLSRKRCPICASESSKTSKITHEAFIDKIFSLVGDEYTVLGKYIDCSTKILIRHNNEECNFHEYEVRPDNFTSTGRRCPECASSKGEQKVSKWLKKNNIVFIPQKEFEDLIGSGGGNLSYDFYLPQYNLLIEYQGEQHGRPVDFNGRGNKFAHKQFEIQQEHDNRKREYAKINNINLLEIWYNDFDIIEKILEEELCRYDSHKIN